MLYEKFYVMANIKPRKNMNIISPKNTSERLPVFHVHFKKLMTKSSLKIIILYINTYIRRTSSGNYRWQLSE